MESPKRKRVALIDQPEEWNKLPKTKEDAKLQGSTVYFTGKPCCHGHIAPHRRMSGCIRCERVAREKKSNGIDRRENERALAKARGDEVYFTGRPCKRGHIAPRLVSQRACTECRREDSRKQRWKDPEAKRKYERDMRSRLKDHFREQARRRRRENPEKINAQCRKSYHKNKHNYKDTRKKWVAANYEKVLFSNRNRYLLQCKCAPSWLTEEHKAAMDKIYRESKRKSIITGIKHNVDHIWPLNGKTSCGLHVPWNLQILTASENTAKLNKDPTTWKRSGIGTQSDDQQEIRASL